MEKSGAKHAFKSEETVDSDSNEEEKERAYAIKKIKCEHIEELIEQGKKKEVEEIQVMVVPKVPAAVAEPLCPTPSKLVVLIFAGTQKPVVKASTTSSSMPVPASTMAQALKPAVQLTPAIKDPFMMRQFKLVDIEESGALIINQVMEISVGRFVGTQTQAQETADEHGDDNDESDSRV
ncbi:hypothetical protein C0995_000829 [Termitomyces sp. Mi166|nr:hypothetical protein C0995_000829 [Termitomyces sp. Mi166\